MYVPPNPALHHLPPLQTKVENTIKYSVATSRVKWLKGEKTKVSRTISVLVLRVLMCLCQGCSLERRFFHHLTN
jgi:hypothetical protein